MRCGYVGDPIMEPAPQIARTILFAKEIIKSSGQPYSTEGYSNTKSDASEHMDPGLTKSDRTPWTVQWLQAIRQEEI